MGRTAADVRDVMIEGESGLKAVSRPDFFPHYEPSKRKVTWPNGTVAHCYSAEEPDLLRGPQHHKAWCDELAAWKYLEAWDHLRFGLRLKGTEGGPQTVITTTPRPLPLLQKILKKRGTIPTRGSTFENRANLDEDYLDELVETYMGTRMGRQELEAEILEDVDGALWTSNLLERQRWRSGGPGTRDFPKMARIVVGVDPGISQGQDADGHGIVAAGKDAIERGFVLEDASLQGSPAEWTDAVLDCVDRWNADAVVVERNRGGDMVKHALVQACQGGRGPDGKMRPQRRVPRIIEVHAADGKDVRAEPFVAMYERNRIFHVREFAELERQQCSWVPGGKSPNGLDALVHALAELFPARSGITPHREKPEGW